MKQSTRDLLIHASIWLAVFFIAMINAAHAGEWFPREQKFAETTWLALHAVDTLQTIQIAKNPGCYREANPLASAVYGTDHPTEARVALTNVALAFAHVRVSTWLDRRVARHQTAWAEGRPNRVGVWYTGRFAWHAVSLLGTGTAVTKNFMNGLTLTSAKGCGL